MSEIILTNSLFHRLDEFYLDLGQNDNIQVVEMKEIKSNPFPGLRPFKTSEFQIFHGRDGQADELIERLRKKHFLAVIGSSGTGKSSLVRAGLIPQLLGGYLYDAGTKWNIAICKPGENPTENLAVALARIKSGTNDLATIEKEYDGIMPILSNTIYGILEVNDLINNKYNSPKEKKNLLIIVDQFEELFRYKRDGLGTASIENQFVNLLLKAAENPDHSIYVIITMRSEFLGDSIKYRGLPEAINAGQYLVPQLNREQIKEVIEDPIRLTGNKISEGLVQLLINEIEQSKTKEDLDQLPILQHALMRTYRQAMLEPDFAGEIIYEHYRECGGMEHALSKHANELFNQLGDSSTHESKKQKIARIVFQALVESSPDQKGGRRATQLKTIYQIATSVEAREAEINEVIDHYRHPEASFILPPLTTLLNPELHLDISHESLTRQWDLLRKWAQAESASSEMLNRLGTAEKLYRKGEKELLKGKELSPIAEWFKRLNPQPAWAARYDKDYAKSFTYLTDSIRLSNIKQIVGWGFSFILLIAAMGFIYYLINNRHKRELGAELQKQSQKEFNLYRSQAALENQDSLAAALFFAEAIMYSNDQDSLLNKSHLYLPSYFLEGIFKNKSNIEWGEFSHNSDSFYLWDDQKVRYTWEAEHRQYLNPIGDSMRSKPSYQSREMSIASVGKLYKKWEVNPDGSGYILNEDLELNVKVPRNIGPINRGVTGEGGNNFLSWGFYKNDSTAGANLWNLNTGTQLGYTMLHSAEIEFGCISAAAKRLAFWDGYDFFVRVFRKVSIDKYRSDCDIPPDLFQIQIQIATGAELKKGTNEIRCIMVSDWQKKYNEWLIKAEQHYRECKYKSINIWHILTEKNH